MTNKKFTYEEMDALWEQTFPGTRLAFSIYDYHEDEDKVTITSDFTSNEPIIKDNCTLSFYTWKCANNMYSNEVTNLTWKKLIDILEEYADDAHVFIECLDIEEDKVFVFLGS